MRNNNIKKLLYIILILLLASPAFGATYYVDADAADDTGTGLVGDPWKTINKVNSVNFANDDIIQFERSDTFNDETLTLDATSATRSGIIVQAYGAGDKPRIDGNSIQPIYINHALVNLTLKDLDVSGSNFVMSSDSSIVKIENVNGLIIDGVDRNGWTGTNGTYSRSNAIGLSRVAGDIEIKNCTLQNGMKDTFANTLSAWGTSDCVGIILWYAGDAYVKTSGTVSIHDNIIHDFYSDCIHLGGVHTTTNIYDNELYNFGENGLDIKYSRYIDFYRNEVYQNDYGAAAGSSYYGPEGIVSGSSTDWSSTYRSQDNIIRENYIHTSPYTGIITPGINSTIRHNYFKNLGNGIVVKDGGAKIHNNLFYLTTGKPTVEPYASRWGYTYLSGIMVDEPAKSSGYIYNNSLYITSSDLNYGIGYRTDTDVSGIIIKNNIVQMTRNSASVYPLYVDNSAGDYPTVSNNAYYNANHSNRVYWKGTVYDSTEEAAFETASSSSDAIFTDPKYTTPATPDLTLQSDSPCIDVGANLGGDYDEGWNPTTSMPPVTVTTIDQDMRGDGWEIGAYVYDSDPVTGDPITITPPGGLTIVPDAGGAITITY